MGIIRYIIINSGKLKIERTLVMAKLTINEARCKGCGLCVTACPKQILALSDKINEKGYNPVMMTDQEKCIGCAFCATMCPDTVIKVEK